MSPLVLSVRGEPEQRLDLSPLIPARLAGLSPRDIAAIELQTTKLRVTAGDIFRIRKGDAARLRFEGGSQRFDRIGLGMAEGEIVVEGDAGAQAGRLMAGGVLAIAGSAGPWAASGMKGGRLRIGRNAGDWLGGPLPGEMAGMRGGLVRVDGNAGAEAGHRLRRGAIVVSGNAGAYAGRAMIAGTLVVKGKAGPLPGYLMQRGTILLAAAPEALSQTFFDCGACDLVFARLLERALAEEGINAAPLLRRPLRRFAGDAAVLGKGEVLMTKM